MGFLSRLGLAPNENDERLKKLISQSYQSVRVVGRGTVQIDPKEVSQSKEFKRAREQAKAIVARS